MCAGIDDVFVLVSIMRNFLEDPKLQELNVLGDLVPEREMRLTLALAGPSVVLTTFSVLAAFFISSLVMKPFLSQSYFAFSPKLTSTIVKLIPVYDFLSLRFTPHPGWSLAR